MKRKNNPIQKRVANTGNLTSSLSKTVSCGSVEFLQSFKNSLQSVYSDNFWRVSFGTCVGFCLFVLIIR